MTGPNNVSKKQEKKFLIGTFKLSCHSPFTHVFSALHFHNAYLGFVEHFQSSMWTMHAKTECGNKPLCSSQRHKSVERQKHEKRKFEFYH